VLNGKAVQGFKLSTADSEAWAQVKDALKATGFEKQAIVLSADRDTEFGRVDHLVSRLSALGYDEVYFLGLMRKEGGQ
jgi:biopolymer transport protein ExbD